MLVSADHKLDIAAWRGSPHWDERPVWANLDLIVVHCISLPEGQFGTGFAQDLFLGTLDTSAHPSFADLDGVEVSPHLFIDRQGGVEQFVSFDKRAWHAGPSCWWSRPRCNDYTVGIEIEGAVNEPFTLAQYDVLVDVLLALMVRYPQLGPDAVVGHSEIAPERKQDPGTFFDWRGLLLELHRRSASAAASA